MRKDSPNSSTDSLSPTDGMFRHRTRAERMRRFVRRNGRRIVAGTALVTTVAAAGVVSSMADSSPKHSKKDEIGLERIIKPQMQKIASAAIKLDPSKNSNVFVTHPASGLTEITGVSTSKYGAANLDVVMRNFPGTQKPNPADVLTAELATVDRTEANPGTGVAFDDDVAYIAPGGKKYASGLASNTWPVDGKGWTAIYNTTTSKDGVVDLYVSGTLDTSSADYYYKDTGGHSHTPVETATRVVAQNQDTLPIVVDALKND